MKQRRAQYLASVLAALLVASFACAPAFGFQLRRISTGEPVRWHQERVTFYLNLESIPSYLERSRVLYIVQQSFATWSKVPSSFLQFEFGGSTTQRTQYDRTAEDNVNTVHFETEKWDDDPDVLALTKTIYEPKTGEIHDADIRINAVNFHWTTSDSDVENDLQNMLTHEVGHVLGLEHSEHQEATMYAKSKKGELSKRVLAQDDVNGVSYLYPSDETIPQVLPDDQAVTRDANVLLGRHDDSKFKYGCNAARDGGSDRGSLPIALALLGLALLAFGGRRWLQLPR